MGTVMGCGVVNGCAAVDMEINKNIIKPVQ